MHLVVGVAGERYALLVDAVREVARVETLSQLPGAGNAVLGLVTLRGEIVPVLDTAALLGARGEVAPRTVVVIDMGGTRAALAVDEVVDVTTMPVELEPAEGPLLAGSAVVVDRLVGVVDVKALLAAAAGEAT